jgi:FkbH-like protein
MSSKSLRCALLSSFTLDQLHPLVTESLRSSGIACEWYIAPFNQYPQLILKEDSDLIAFAPQLIFFAVAIEDVLDSLPSLWSQSEERLEAGHRRIQDLVGLAERLAKRLPRTRIFMHDFLSLEPQPHALLAAKSPASVRALVLYANRLLVNLSYDCGNLFVLPLDDALAGQPRLGVLDSRFFYLAKMRLGRGALDSLTEYYRRLVLAHLGLRKKCLVLDLDNMLWGGIVGEDGPENLLIADDGPGKAFQDAQRILLQYHETGTLLAVCSRNDEQLALSILRDHPGMILRPHHFAAMRINWEDKATNLRAIAEELNLGLDSLVFLDDSAFEREQIRRVTPGVAVPDMPIDPADYPSFLARLPYFDALTVTEDDRKRGQMYVVDRQRRELQQSAATLEDFLEGLDIRVVVRRADRFVVPRLAQLTQRTNQFNLTTRRYTESDLLELAQQDGWRLYGAEARDRVGESGIVGTAIVQLGRPSATARLDTFLVSCRVLGRGIESAFLAGVLMDLKAAGMASLQAEFVPSERNAVAKDFLAQNGFVLEQDQWQRPLVDANVVCPKWIDLQLFGQEKE